MNRNYVRVIEFMGWLIGEIIRLTKEGAPEELAELADQVAKVRPNYKANLILMRKDESCNSEI